MGSIERRLAKLEQVRDRDAGSLSRGALRHLADEDLLKRLEVLETEVENGKGDFWDLYAVVGEKGRRALDAYYEAYEAARRGEEPPRRSSRSPPDGMEEVLELMKRAEAGDEEAQREVAGRDGYRIWKHYREKGTYR